MKRMTAAVLFALVLITLAAGPVFAAPEFEVPAGPPAASAADFTQHVVTHAQDGILGEDHNPGLHQGLANFEHHTP